MKNLQALFEECMNEAKAIGIVPGRILSVKVNNRFTAIWGRCSYINKKTGTYKIELNKILLEDTTTDQAAKNTIMHEILHSCDGCMNHGDKWKEMAYKVNRAYPSYYNIKRTTSNEEKGIEVKKKEYNYMLKCESCGHLFGYYRITKAVQHPERYRCNCGGKLIRYNNV